MSKSILLKVVLLSLGALIFPWQSVQADRRCIGILCAQQRDPFGGAFSGNPMGVPMLATPMPGFGGSMLPGLDMMLMNAVVGRLPPSSLPPEVLERARILLRLPPGTDFTQRGTGPALVIAGEPKESEKALPEFLNNRDPFLESADPVALHFQKKGMDTRFFHPGGELGSPNNIEALVYLERFRALLSVVEMYPGFFKKIAIVSHGNIIGGRDVYVEPEIGKPGITLTGEQITACEIYFYGCGAQRKGLNFGQMQRLAEEHAATDDYFKALSNRTMNWSDTIYGILGRPPPQAPHDRSRMQFITDEDLRRRASFFGGFSFWSRR